MAEKIFGSDTLQHSFDRVSPDKNKLDILEKMGIDPKFKEELRKMFEEINASVKEITEARSDILREDKYIKSLNGRERIHRLKKAANEIAHDV